MKISVCMCTYNGERFIRQQLKSLVTQTKVPDEIVIFDDCSSDDTKKIIKQYVNEFKNISWSIIFNEINKGWKVNFYEAINRTSGDYIFLCDQDDIWMEDKIEKMIKIMTDRNDIELLVCNPVIKHENTGKKIYKFNNNQKIEKVIKDNFLTHTAFPGCTFCFKRNIIEYFNSIWQSDFPHDAILWKIAYLRETLYVYNYYGIIWRRHESNATNKLKKKFSIENVKLHYEIILLYKAYFKNLSMLSSITKLNIKKINDVKRMLELREKLYIEKKSKYFLKLIKYRKYYASRKAYLLDLLALSKFNKCVGNKNEK